MDFSPKFKQVIVFIYFKYLSLNRNHLSYEYKIIHWKHPFFLLKLNLWYSLAELLDITKEKKCILKQRSSQESFFKRWFEKKNKTYQICYSLNDVNCGKSQHAIWQKQINQFGLVQPLQLAIWHKINRMYPCIFIFIFTNTQENVILGQNKIKSP